MWEKQSLPQKSNLCVVAAWSVRVVALLSEGPSSCFCIHQLLFPCLEVLVQGASPRRSSLLVCLRDGSA